VKILLGITGSVAAYKAAYLARALVREGFEVQGVLTPEALNFIGRAGIEALTGKPAHVDFFPEHTSQEVPLHIGLARWADLVLVAPATAEFMVSYAEGRAHNLLLGVLSVFEGPVIVAPAMHREMWEALPTQEALRRLRERGVVVIEPEEGALASGDWGKGRLRNEEEIVEVVHTFARLEKELAGRRVVVCYGRTEEPIDEVRVVSNRSSGQMGYWLAWWARALGAHVATVVGRTDTPPLATDPLIHAPTVESMYTALEGLLDRFSPDYFLMAAAVSDYIPARRLEGKKKREDGIWVLELKPAPDLLKSFAHLKRRHAFWMGFSLEEPENLVERATRKMKEKSLDAIFANPLKVMGQPTGEGVLITARGETVPAPTLPKAILARWIWQEILARSVHGSPYLA